MQIHYEFTNIATIKDLLANKIAAIEKAGITIRYYILSEGFSHQHQCSSIVVTFTLSFK